MQSKRSYCLILLLLCFGFGIAQDKEEKTSDIEVGDEVLVLDDTVTRKPLDPLSPSRAAFYSAILPGLGQAYNKRYWKIPIVYAAIGTGVYFYIRNLDPGITFCI